MNNPPRLPVFRLVGEAFSYVSKNFLQITVLNAITFTLLVGPIVLLVAVFFQEYFNALAAQTEALTKQQLREVAIRLFPINVFMAGATLLLAPIIHTTIISSITNGSTLLVPRLNRNVLRYLFAASIIGSLAIALIALAGSLAALAYVGISHMPSAQKELLFAGGAVITLATLYGLIRLSLVPAEVVANSKLGVTRGFEITKGNIVPLLFAYLVTAILIILIAFMIAFLGPLVLGPEGPLYRLWTWDIPGTDKFFYLNLPDAAASPLTAIWSLTTLLIQIFTSAIAVTIPALAFAHLNGNRILSPHNEVLHEVTIKP
ncbi:MAG: hypothetical protein EP347_08850 [Alphaproteobacteria bacterium]|nr:MAG: hypothetical protein EP347_08850 [Alphaproteobacteria bacterium]